MRLPIENDCIPRLSNKEISDNDNEAHVKLLAKRLHKDKKLAEQQSKLGQETAKRYYDRYTKLEQFNKGDFVCEHDHTHKRSMARKFSY
jgi:hypothetical protein